MCDVLCGHLAWWLRRGCRLVRPGFTPGESGFYLRVCVGVSPIAGLQVDLYRLKDWMLTVGTDVSIFRDFEVNL